MSDNRREALEALRDKVKAGVEVQPREFRVIAPEGLIANDDLYEFWIDAWVNAEKAHNGSLDAAKALHDAVLPGWVIHDMGNNSRSMGWTVVIASKAGDYASSHEGQDCRQENPARAWLLSILSALISETPKGETL